MDEKANARFGLCNIAVIIMMNLPIDDRFRFTNSIDLVVLESGGIGMYKR